MAVIDTARVPTYPRRIVVAEDGRGESYQRLLHRLTEDYGLSVEDLEKVFDPYPDSLRRFLVATYERGELEAFRDAFRFTDLLDGLGCTECRLSEPERWESVEVSLLRPDGRPKVLLLARSELQLDRRRLARLLKRQLGVDRPTIEISVLSERVRELTRGSDTPFDLDAPMLRQGDPPENDRKRITRQILRAPAPSEVAVAPEAPEGHVQGELGRTVRKALDAADDATNPDDAAADSAS